MKVDRSQSPDLDSEFNGHIIRDITNEAYRIEGGNVIHIWNSQIDRVSNVVLANSARVRVDGDIVGQAAADAYDIRTTDAWIQNADAYDLDGNGVIFRGGGDNGHVANCDFDGGTVNQDVDVGLGGDWR